MSILAVGCCECWVPEDLVVEDGRGGVDYSHLGKGKGMEEKREGK